MKCAGACLWWGVSAALVTFNGGQTPVKQEWSDYNALTQERASVSALSRSAAYTYNPIPANAHESMDKANWSVGGSELNISGVNVGSAAVAASGANGAAAQASLESILAKLKAQQEEVAKSVRASSSPSVSASDAMAQLSKVADISNKGLGLINKGVKIASNVFRFF